MRGLLTPLARDCEVTMIPSGERVMVPAGTEVRVLQTLGGNVTVQGDYGQLMRIDEKDADALGADYVAQNPKPAESEAPAEEGAFDEERVWEQLRTVYDPEIPVNIVELGLVYQCKATPLPEGGQRVEIQMTVTAPGCGMGPVLVDDVRRKVQDVPGVKEANVELVWEPPWDQSRMSDVARLQLGWM
ncbi:putative Fe-S cluster assembly protein SufT [Archangium violaceum]|jgi:probable FeS assembly SUF system protein SufT|uniref:putative Fe-S cluster assembly protein SufT n=1 Tax=Archangium violaceum TaxID=83451 RepID=UPI00194F9CA6|nr:putative Fe-S cluster assembly protein SufT [Archangium violaceum]QRN95688.1 putative Fe-S cluster assembly protein SufT [Archangium violaceum]